MPRRRAHPLRSTLRGSGRRYSGSIGSRDAAPRAGRVSIQEGRCWATGDPEAQIGRVFAEDGRDHPREVISSVTR